MKTYNKVKYFVLVAALLAWELANTSVTQYALQNLLGDIKIQGMEWATLLTIAFASIDFVVFAKPNGKNFWCLYCAWLLGIGMNAVLTWWAITIALLKIPGVTQHLVNAFPLEVSTMFLFVRLVIVSTIIVLWHYKPDVTAK